MSLSYKDKFLFPYEPYSIQVEFMENLYRVLDDGKIGIFESPTGTGKSLSLICGTLTWLKDYEKRIMEDLENQLQLKKCELNSNIDWFQQFTKQKEEELSKKEIKEKYEKYKNRENRLKDLKKVKIESKIDTEFDELFKNAEEIRFAVEKALKDDENEDESLLIDYNSEDEIQSDLQDLNEDSNDDLIARIYYCTRTHSQLTQFVREIEKSQFSTQIRVVSLVSRQTTCINRYVNRLKSLALINDQCLNLLKKSKGKSTLLDANKTVKKTKITTGCPFYKANAIESVRNEILSRVVDIEELVDIGKKKRGCPFYASRRAAVDAEVVVLPYNTLLHRKTRESSGIKLKDSIIIIDEAHNLTDAITNMHSIELTGAELLKAHSQLEQYQQRYKLRLKATNVFNVNRLLFVLTNLIKEIGGEPGVFGCKNVDKSIKISNLNDFLSNCQLDNVNLFKIIDFCDKSEIAKKIIGFVEKYRIIDDRKEVEKGNGSSVSKFLEKMEGKSKLVEKEEKIDERESIVLNSPLNRIISFFDALTNTNKDGRIVVNVKGSVEESSLKYMALNPSTPFEDIVKNARAIVVAGGTMQPISEFIDHLFLPAGAKRDKIINFSYGHVIPANNLLAIATSNGPSGLKLDFSYENRSNPTLIDELGRIVTNISNIIPGGIVVFFPSYDYLNTVHDRWSKTGTAGRIASKKKIFTEPKTSNLAQQMLKEYSNLIKKKNGAIILSVVGGKMSEGINFSDDLGRCVVMVGMPYPNIKSKELMEKMDYLNENLVNSNSGQIYYENLCFKSINQSIGRAIRHIDDYSTILLIDSRYSKPKINQNLPSWISSNLVCCDSFGKTFANIRKFFNTRK